MYMIEEADGVYRGEHQVCDSFRMRLISEIDDNSGAHDIGCAEIGICTLVSMTCLSPFSC